MVKTHLDVHGNDNAESSLICYTTSSQRKYWRCEAHAHRNLNHEFMLQLKDFIRSRGGCVDMRLAKLRAELGSTPEADQFRSLLLGTKHVVRHLLEAALEGKRAGALFGYCQNKSSGSGNRRRYARH